MTAEKTFNVQMMGFFGLLPGQSRQDFLRELKALTPGDRAELMTLLDAAGFPVAAATTATEAA